MKTFFEMLDILEADQAEARDQVQGPEEQPMGPEQEADKGLGDQSGGAPQQNQGQGMQHKHYMFFSNLKAIKKMAEEMLAMDPAAVDQMIGDGHDWASDHISTSRDDIEEVHNWLSGEVSGQEPAPPSA